MFAAAAQGENSCRSRHHAECTFCKGDCLCSQNVPLEDLCSSNQIPNKSLFHEWWHAAAAGSDLGKILAIIAVGMPASLIFTAQVAVSIRKMVNTKLEDTPTPKKLPPFKPFHYSLWGASCPHGFIVYICRRSRPAYRQV